MDELFLNPRCRLLGDLDFNPRREAPIRDYHFNGECVSKENEVHRIYIGVCLELSHILATYPCLELQDWDIMNIPELGLILIKLEIP